MAGKLSGSLIVIALLASASVACFLFSGCSSSSSPKTVTSLTLSLDSTGVEVCTTLSITAAVKGGDSKAVDWYVNGAFGGQVSTGTISQTNPAIFTAPEVVPVEPLVAIKVVSQEEPSMADSCVVSIKFTTIYVNAATGNDDTGSGCVTHPFKTITTALGVAQDNMTVLVAPGIYDVANGETFPILLHHKVALVGQSRENTIIRMAAGPGAAVDISGDGATIKCLTLQGPAPTSQWGYAIYVNAGTTNAVIDSLIIPTPGYYGIIGVRGTVNTTIKNCMLGSAANDRTYRGLEIASDDAGTIIKHCTISGFMEGIFLNMSSNALIEGCTIENNNYGINTCCLNSDESNPNPDLGGGARGSLGGNVVRNNVYYGLANTVKSTIYAKYNTWGHNPPTFGSAAGSDIYNQGTGSVIWQ